MVNILGFVNHIDSIVAMERCGSMKVAIGIAEMTECGCTPE